MPLPASYYPHETKYSLTIQCKGLNAEAQVAQEA